MITKEEDCKRRIDLIEKQVNQILMLVAIWATKGRAFEDRVDILKRCGFTNGQISKITNKALDNVKEVLL